jgi:hypothetical protein
VQCRRSFGKAVCNHATSRCCTHYACSVGKLPYCIPVCAGRQDVGPGSWHQTSLSIDPIQLPTRARVVDLPDWHVTHLYDRLLHQRRSWRMIVRWRRPLSPSSSFVVVLIHGVPVRFAVCCPLYNDVDRSTTASCLGSADLTVFFSPCWPCEVLDGLAKEGHRVPLLASLLSSPPK